MIGFKTRLNIAPLSQAAGTKDPAVVYNHKLPLKPGLYQVRVAVRDEKSGKVGSAAQWIEIPDLSPKKLTLATLLLDDAKKPQTQQVQFSIDRRFTRESHMTFLTIIYNAAATSGGPKLESQIEILRRGQRVIAVRYCPSRSNRTQISREFHTVRVSRSRRSPLVAMCYE